jgi:hypothetical protein
MSISAICLCAAVLSQAGSVGDEAAGSQLQFNPLQSSAKSDLQSPQGVGLAAPQPASDLAPAALQPDSAAPRSVYGDPVEAAADSPPSLKEPQSTLAGSAPAVLSTPSPAESLLRQALTAQEEASIQGRPVALKSLLGQQTAGSRQVDTVRAYWRLTHAVADYNYAVEEHRFLAAVPVVREDQLSLQAAQASAKAEQAESRLAAVRAQQALAEIAPAASGGKLPLPADMPVVGTYRTHFKELNQRGAARDELGLIDQSLPVIRDVIDAQAEAVAAAAAVLPPALQAYQQGQTPLAAVLDAHERLRRHRRAFLTAVERYNAEIAGYALSVSLPAVTGERMAGMLIEERPTGRSVLAGKKTGSDIQRVSNEENLPKEPDGLQFRTPKLDKP